MAASKLTPRAELIAQNSLLIISKLYNMMLGSNGSDEVREWGDETDAAGKRGTYEKLGIKCIFMKNDFATIYGNDVKKDIKAPTKQ